MAGGAEVRGQAELRALARSLKEFGDKDVRREFYRALQQSAGPLIAEARRQAKTRLPRGGGIGEYVSGHLQARVKTAYAGSSNPRVRVVFSAPNEAAKSFKEARRRDVHASRKRHREKTMTDQERAARAEKRRAAAKKAAATRKTRRVV